LRRSLSTLSILAVLAALALVTAAPAAYSAQPEPVRIMPLGDSITGSPGCWRSLLWNRLQDTGHTGVDFVGTLPPQGCGLPHDGDNEGHGGALVTSVANQNQLPGWLSATNPGIVLMHFGTNDVWSARPVADILAAYGTLVDQMRASNPTMRVLVAQIIPMDPDRSCAECADRVVALNAAIPGWAAGKSTAQSPVTVVDQWTGFSTGTDTYDGVHPNAAGDQKISDRWYPALAAALDGVAPTPGPSPSPTTPAPGGCTAAYQVVGQWPGGFQGALTVSNPGPASISSWTVRFSFADGQQVSSWWGGVLSQTGAEVTVRNQAWNGNLGPGVTVTAGFLASWEGTNSVPTPSCTPG
jgi:lysophospholipase L1-like esterase